MADDMAHRILIDKFTLLDLVHDRWFDLGQLKTDSEKHEVELYLGEKRKGPYDEKILKITKVLRVAIDDRAQIGIYDLSDIKITATSIRLESPMSLVITVTVGEGCEISLVQNAENRDGTKGFLSY